MGLRQQLLQIRKELDAYASEPYLVEVAGALDTRMAIASKTVEAVQRPLQRQNEALERLRVPRSWLALHNAYAAQLNSYLAALKTYYGAAEGDSVAAAEIAARALGEQQRKVDKLVEEYRAALWAYYSGSA
jgi:hypothetical protein